MGLFTPGYLKDGPGVALDAPRKKGLARLWELLDSIHPEAVPERLQAYRDGLGQRMYTVREMLRLAVYVGSWEQAAQYLYPQWIWKARPKQAFSQEEIAVLLGKNLWQ